MFARLFALFVASLLSISSATAQDTPRSILVLDASGSMWGQIDGITKIEIAREVVGNLLEELPAENELGLTVYGHRRKGDCSDIETLIAPAAGQNAAIAAAVNAVNPRGKTPMTAAVVAAAEALRFTEERATVILVSDGIETCEPDPCAIARTLEETGVDFTAHVVGFDVSDPEALAQMQCLADETGGTFTTAANAEELTEALSVVAEPPAPEPFDVTFLAKSGGINVSEGISWTVTSAAGEVLLDGGDDFTPTLELLPGAYDAAVTRAVDGASASTAFLVENTHQTVILELPELPPEPSLLFAQAYVEGTNERVRGNLVWWIYAEDGTEVVSNDAGDAVRADVLPGAYRVEVLRTTDEASAEAEVIMERIDQTVRLELPELVEPAPLRLSAQEEGVNGALRRDLLWSLYDRDGTPVFEGTVGSAVNTSVMPGRYTVRVVRQEDGHEVSEEFAVLKRGTTHRVLFPTFAPPATIDAADSAPVGDVILLDWTGPDEENDFIAIAATDMSDARYLHYAYTRHGPTLELQMPSQPGSYELRYVLNNGRTVITRRMIEVTEVTATLNAPETFAAGADAPVTWTGPDYQNDYIAVSEIGARSNQQINYAYTRNGDPAALQMPTEPGIYELRYVMNLDRTILATRQIEVVGVDYAVSGPESAIAGDTITVDWTGPDYQNDYIAVARVGNRGNQQEGYAYTRNGNPAELRLPLEPGDYELRYITAQDRVISASQPIRIDPVTASLTAPTEGVAGETITLTWEGPDYQNDFIAVAEAGSRENTYINYSYTRDGSPLQLTLPAFPGDYEIRYIAQGNGRTMLTSTPITVEEVTASVSGPLSAAPDSEIVVEWTGPGYDRDFIAISVKGDDRSWPRYTYTNDGNPLRIRVPADPGDYEIRYILGQERRILARQEFSVE